MEYVGADKERVVYKRDENGRLVRVSGKETDALKRLVSAINNSSSNTAKDQFMAINNNQTKVTILIGKGLPMGKGNGAYHYAHDKDGNLLDMDKPEERAKAAKTADGKEFAAATIAFDTEKLFSDENMNTEPGFNEDEMLAQSVVHESSHNTDPAQIEAVLSGSIDNSVFHPKARLVTDKFGRAQMEYPENSPGYYTSRFNQEIRDQRTFNSLYNGGCLVPPW